MNISNLAGRRKAFTAAIACVGILGAAFGVVSTAIANDPSQNTQPNVRSPQQAIAEIRECASEAKADGQPAPGARFECAKRVHQNANAETRAMYENANTAGQDKLFTCMSRLGYHPQAANGDDMAIYGIGFQYDFPKADEAIRGFRGDLRECLRSAHSAMKTAWQSSGP